MTDEYNNGYMHLEMEYISAGFDKIIDKSMCDSKKYAEDIIKYMRSQNN